MARLCALALVATSFAACGGSSSPAAAGGHGAQRSASVVLDFTPNAVHTGIYAAIARHLDRAAGVALHVIVPSASTDSISLLRAGRVRFAILDIHDLAIAHERGIDLVGIMAIVERPLAAVIARPTIRAPRQLEGEPVGITGVPSDTAVLHSIVAGAGGDARRVHTITIGFNAVPDLLAGKVAGATAFWNDEGVTLEHDRPGFQVFRVDHYGAPPYPELVLSTTATELRRNRALAQAVVSAVVGGYRFALAEPLKAAGDLEALVPGLDPTLVSAQLRALLPAFRAADGRVGTLNPSVLERWATWETRFGIVARRPDVGAMFDPSLADRANSAAG